VITLFSNQTTSAAGGAVSFTDFDSTLIVSGNFGGGTFTLEGLSPDGSWVEIEGAQSTAPSIKSVSLSPMQIRAKLTGATNANLNAYLLEA